MTLTVGAGNQNAMQSMQAIREKGLGNRLEHSGARIVNFEKTKLKTALVGTAGVAGSIGTAALIAKSPLTQKILSKAGSKIANSSLVKGAVSAIAPTVAKAAKWVGALPMAGKVALGVGLAATAIATRIIRNQGIKNAGRIEQKYNDMAALDKQLR